jgi:hypothetical protein
VEPVGAALALHPSFWVPLQVALIVRRFRLSEISDSFAVLREAVSLDRQGCRAARAHILLPC